MNETPRRVPARPVFRWLAAITVPVFAVMAGVAVLGILDANGKPDVFMTMVFTWFATMFGSIAVTGKFEMVAARPFRLLVVAKKYADDEITLEEYGSRTRDILRGQ